MNGEPVDLKMKLDDSGVAFFVEEVDRNDELWPKELVTSPIADKTDSEFEMSWKKKKEETIIHAQDLNSSAERPSDDREKEESKNNSVDVLKCPKEKKKTMRKQKQRFSKNGPKRSLTDALLRINTLTDSIDEMFDLDEIDASEQENTELMFESSDLQGPLMTISMTSDKEVLLIEDKNCWKWGQLPDTIQSTITQDKTEMNEYHQSIYLNPIKEVLVDPLDVSDNCGKQSINQTEEETKFDQGSSLSLPTKPLTESRRMERIDSGCEVDQESQNYETDLPNLISNFLPDLAASLCGGLTGAAITPDQFEADLLTFPQLVQQLIAGTGSVVTDQNLVIRVHEKYLSWDKASPILLSVILYGTPLPCDVVREITKNCLDVNITIAAEDVNMDIEEKPSSWLDWFSRTPRGESITEVYPRPQKQRLDTESSSTSMEDSDDDHVVNKRKFYKTLKLSSERLAALKLKPGCNEVQFSVTTAFQGTSRCSCYIYLWHHSDKVSCSNNQVIINSLTIVFQVVISDIDGTITKSDVLGQILPVIGQDWAQSGVAQLFTKISNNSYHIMYLSARAIGQASITKDYLQSVKQDDVPLPDGPLFLNPDSFIQAFKREVIDRNPEEFKISCLKDIKSLFGERNPFFAGYGNRPNVRT